MQPDDLKKFLTDISAERLALLQRHEAAARVVGHYDFNNTYQYVIARDDMHVRWLQDAITDTGGTPEEQALPDIDPGKGKDAQLKVITADRDAAAKFVERWRDRVETLPNARHRSLLKVILGESLEQQRFFEQGLAGREDLLGRRADGAGTGDGVLATRWVGE